MRPLLFALIFAACTGSPAPADPKPGGTTTTPTPTDSTPTDSAPTDSTSTDSTPTDSTPTESDPPHDSGSTECREEGESCTIDEEGQHNCCMSRHTCFPEGCYYSLPG